MPQNDMTGNEVVQVKTRTGKVVPVYKKNLAEAMKLGATPVVIADKDKNVGAPTSPTMEHAKEFGREAVLKGYEKIGIPSTEHPIKDALANMAKAAKRPTNAVGNQILSGNVSPIKDTTFDPLGTIVSGIGGSLGEVGKAINFKGYGSMPQVKDWG